MDQVLSDLIRVDTGGKAEVYEIPNFLSDMECAYLVNLIDQNNERSTVVDSNDSGRTMSDYRTSSSAFLSLENGGVAMLNRRMHDYLPETIGMEYGEDPQGQKYEPGQFFKDHTDYFDVNDEKSYKMHVGDTGQRNWTFMIYLNDVEEGGETDFPNLQMKFFPKRGTAIIWKNLNEDGTGNPNTLHAGRPPVKGTKYIITKWFRNGESVSSNGKEESVPPAPQIRTEKFEIRPVNTTQIGQHQFSSWKNIPRFTELGFKVVDVPETAWGLIQDAYKLLKPFARTENYEGMGSQIYNKEKGHGSEAAEVLPLWELPTTVKLIHKLLQPIHEEWSGAKLEPSFIYGIRSYLDGATLFAHRDRIETHHISTIILVDEDSREPWGLDIQDHAGNWHKVYIKPGQMILYESAACDHARLDAFQGNYFRNFFCHYKLTEFEYVPE